MPISPPPQPAQKKKSGCGCFGCGCALCIVLLVLFLGLLGAGSYFGFKKAVALTSMTPAEIPKLADSGETYTATQQKIGEFQRNTQSHQPATIHLSADELNSIFANDPDLAKKQVHFFVKIADDAAELQGTIPCDNFAPGLLNGRYVNFDTTFGLSFNSDSHTINVDVRRMKVGDHTEPQNILPVIQAELGPLMNLEFQKNEATRNLLRQAKTLEVKNGELVIETQ